MNNLSVIIIGTSHHNTLSVVRSVGLVGIKPRLLLYNCTNSYVAKSKFILETLYFNSSLDIIIFLKKNRYSAAPNSIILSCTDEIAYQLDCHLLELRPYYKFFSTANQGDLTYYMNKQVQMQLAKDVGFSVPNSMILSGGKVEKWTFPCLIKPVASINGGKKIRVCNCRSELDLFLKDFQDVPVQIQQFIKKDYEIVIVGLSFQTKIYIPAFIRKYHDIDGGTTFSRVHPIDELPAPIYNATLKMIETVGYEGLWGLECIISSGTCYFIELNLRNDATTYSIVKAGVNLPMMFVALASGNSSWEKCIEKKCYSINSIVEPNELIYLLKNKQGVFSWIKNLKISECKYIYEKGDIRPLISLLIDYLKSIMKKVLGG